MSEPQQTKTPRKLDDVMLAMDVVDTLRHEQTLLARDLSADEREDEFVARLREIYKAQGIEVPDEILRDGVKALDEHRFAYTPQKPGFFSKAYINRRRWGRPLIAILAIAGLTWGANYALFEAPAKARAERTQQILQTDLPAALAKHRDAALAISESDALSERANALHDAGIAAAKDGDLKEAKRINNALQTFAAELAQSYTLRIVSRPGESSGVYRSTDDNIFAYNYYLIVEGIDASGRPLAVTIVSEEDQKSQQTKMWGVRVPKDVFDRVAADKRDDQIIQNAIIGKKARGLLAPDYNIRTSGGLILEW